MSRPGLPKLIATDLDGTLVRSDDTVSAYTHAVLDRVRSAGIPLVGVTGRGPRIIELCRQDIPEAHFLVLAQGARVVDLTDPAGPVTLRAEVVDGAVVAGVLEAFAHSERYAPDELLAIARELPPARHVTVTQAGLGYIEICPRGVTKASGLAVVADSLGVDPRDVLVFGDMPNDLPMFGWAGWSRVAVANAHPEVLAMADEVTASNDADGVARYLDRLLSER